MSGHGPLAGYRALDLTDHRGALAGRLLADLGVDAVKVEPPGGDPDRGAPPWAGDRAGPTRSLAWLPVSFGKRSLTLDLETEDGRAALRRPAAAADFVPVWGEHTDRVFGEILGLSSAEVGRLRAAEVIW